MPSVRQRPPHPSDKGYPPPAESSSSTRDTSSSGETSSAESPLTGGAHSTRQPSLPNRETANRSGKGNIYFRSVQPFSTAPKRFFRFCQLPPSRRRILFPPNTRSAARTKRTRPNRASLCRQHFYRRNEATPPHIQTEEGTIALPPPRVFGSTGPYSSRKSSAERTSSAGTATSMISAGID